MAAHAGERRYDARQAPDDLSDRCAPDVRPDAVSPVHALQAQVARLEGELVGKNEALVEARARADAAEARSVELSADLLAERAKTEKAIVAFSALADRLDALAEHQRQPFLKRLKQRLVGC